MSLDKCRISMTRLDSVCHDSPEKSFFFSMKQNMSLDYPCTTHCACVIRSSYAFFLTSNLPAGAGPTYTTPRYCF